MEGEAGGSPSIAREACPVPASSDRTQTGLFVGPASHDRVTQSVRASRSRPICVLYEPGAHTYRDAPASPSAGSAPSALECTPVAGGACAGSPSLRERLDLRRVSRAVLLRHPSVERTWGCSP